MKALYSLVVSAALLFGGPKAAAQNRPAAPGPAYQLGSSQQLVKQLETQVAAGAARRGPATVALRVSAARTFTGKVNYRQDLSASGEYLVGEIEGVAGSSFLLRIEGPQVEGHIILRATRQAYRYAADAQGNVTVQEVDINQVICIDYDKPTGYQKKEIPSADQRAAGTTANAVVSLQSLPGARGCIMLDFDGQYVPAGSGWNNGNPIDAAPSAIANDNAKIQAFWELVSEDFRPFSLNITTDEAVFNTYPKNMRRRCIITPTNTAAPGAGGVAYVGGFSSNNDHPCWVFMSDPKAGGEAASHEVGHTLGLLHDGRTSPSEGYYDGKSHVAWSPIMGVGYYKPVTHWSKGEYASANNKEDDLAIMSGTRFNVGYRNDDHGNTTAGATALARNGTGLAGQGVIERQTDQDYFSFTTGGGTVSLNVNTVGRYGNLDIVARLFNSAGAQLGAYDTAGGGNLNVAFSTTLAAGTYYLQVDGTSAGNVATDGYSDYGSLGTFSITGSAPAGGTPPPSTGASVATFYRDCNYTGAAVGLPVGDYTLAQLQARGINNDDISSVRLSTGFEVRLFDLDNYGGAGVVLGADDDCLVNRNWNDKASSVKVSFAPGATNLAGVYSVQNRNSSLFLDVSDISQTNGAVVHQWTSNNGGGNQQFRFAHLGGGVYKITAEHSGKAWDVAGVSTAEGALLTQWDYAGGGHQQFVVQATGDGHYRFLAVHSGQALEIGQGSLDIGADARQWNSNNSPTQQWKLTPVGSAVASSLLQAENANVNKGMQAEACADTDGGQNMAYVDAGDYLTFNSISFPVSGSYLIEYRVASPGGGTLSADLNGGATLLGNTAVPATGGWQTWRTVSQTVNVNAGTYNFGVYAQTGGWNINWVRISPVSAAAGEPVAAAPVAAPAAARPGRDLELYPNPVTDRLRLHVAPELLGSQYQLLDALGRTVATGRTSSGEVDVSALRPGVYRLQLITKEQRRLTRAFVKQ